MSRATGAYLPAGTEQRATTYSAEDVMLFPQMPVANHCPNFSFPADSISSAVGLIVPGISSDGFVGR